MAKSTKFPSNREQAFAFHLAQGLTCAEAGRRAGYAPSTIRSSAHLFAARPHIQALVSQYRKSLGFVDAGMLDTFLADLRSIASNGSLPARDRFAAINRMIAFFEDFHRNRDWQAAIPAYLFTPLGQSAKPGEAGTKAPSKYPSKPIGNV